MAEGPKDQFEAAELGILREALANRYPWADWANWRTVDRDGTVFDWAEKPCLHVGARPMWFPYRPCKFEAIDNTNKTTEVWNLLIVKRP